MAEVVNMLAEKKGQVPTPHELQKAVKEFADIMQKLVVLMKNSGIEGKQLPDAVKPSDVARAVNESPDKGGLKL